MAKRKLSRKEIRQDKLVTLTLRSSQFIQAHYNKVVAGIIILVAVVAGAMFTSNARRGAAAAAEQELAVAMDQYLLGDKEGASTTFLGIADRYSGHNAGEVSLYFLAECYYGLNRFNEAVDAYDRYINKAGATGTFTLAAKMGKAVSYETLLQFDLAVATMEDVLAFMDPEDARYADALFRMGTYHEELRDTNKAVEYYRRADEVATGRLKDRVAVKLALMDR